MPSSQLYKRFETRHRQSGISLILLVFLIGLAATGFAVKSLSSGSVQIQRNVSSTQALEKAKASVIGKVITQSGNNVGQFPCAEDPTLIGLIIEGQVKASCSNTATSIGRFAWRTMGTGDIRDGNNDNLWYALSPGFQAMPVNSESVAGLSIDGVPNQAIAILFSPGTALSTQSRPSFAAPSGPNVTNYLDGSNGDGDASFVTGIASTTFNDKSTAIKPDDIYPVLEKGVLGEIKNYLVAYKAAWGAFPFPATFSNPTTASYIGASANSGGLLPIADAGLAWGGATATSVRTSNGAIRTGTCTPSGSTLTCSITGQNYSGSRTITINATVNNLGLGFYKQMDIAKTSDFAVTPAALRSQLTLTPTMNSSGSGTLNLVATATTRTATYSIVFNHLPTYDDWNTTAAIPNYIYKNNWHQLMYYKVATPYLPGGTASCAPSCLLVVNKINVTPNITQTGIHALLISSGRKLDITNARPAPAYGSLTPAQTRSGTVLADYLDSTNNTTADLIFDSTNLPLTTFNDQVEVVE